MSRRSRKENAPVHKDTNETTKNPADAARLLESLRSILPSLADCAELTALADKVEIERKAIQSAKPLSVKAKHLEGRLAHKRRTQASAQERVERTLRALEEAQGAADAARAELNARNEELQALEKEIAELPTEPAPMDARFAGVPQLPEELAGDKEAEEAIAKAQAAAEAAQKMLEAKLQTRSPPAATASAPTGNDSKTATADGDEVFMDFDIDATVEELRKDDDLAAFGGSDGAPDRGRIRRLMEAVARGTRRKTG